MRSTRYETERRNPYDPMDLAALRQWQREQQQDNRAQIERLLSKLPVAVDQELTPRQRQMLMMHFHDGMRVTDIARALGVSKSVVSRTLARSTERLFRVLRYSL